MNRYAYVLNDPINSVDPSGLLRQPGNSGGYGGGIGPELDPFPSITSCQDFYGLDDEGEGSTYLGYLCGTTQLPSFVPPQGGGGGKPICTLVIKINNNAGLGKGDIKNLKTKISDLFSEGQLGIQFTDSGKPDYSLNLENANGSTTDLGQTRHFFRWTGTPTAFADNISAKVNEGTVKGAEIFGGPLDRAIADIGAHELFHGITGTGNVPYDPKNPNDLMSIDSNPEQKKALLGNHLAFTAGQFRELIKRCLKKHPK